MACENNGNCDVDQRAFKGIAARSFARAARAAPIVADSLHDMLDASSRGAAENCKGSGNNVACRLNWSSSGDKSWDQETAGDGNLGEVLNALSAVQAVIWRTAAMPNSTVGFVSPNATTSSSPSGASSIVLPTGRGSTLAASFTCALVVAFAAALSC